VKCSAHGFLLFISLLLTILHTACGRTTGNGIIISSLVGTECEFDSSADQVFDIGFFAATIFDADGPRRLSLLNNVKRGDSSSMSIRLQASSTTIEYADGILLELSNLEQLGKVFREDTAVIVDSANRCPQCQPPIVPLARASVSIGPLCGGFNETLQSFPITADTSIEQFEEDDGGSSDDKSCEAVDIPSTYTGNCSLNENSR